jgi:predicted MFS family arabinose efflux permease
MLNTESKAPIFAMYLLTATLMISYGAIFSLLAEIRDQVGFDSAGVGYIAAAAFAAGFIAQISLSRFADAGYGRLMVRSGIAICIISSAWMIVADSLLEWIFSRAALGFGAGIIRPAIRRFIIVANPSMAGRSLGILTAYETAGFLIGPVIAAILNTAFGVGATFAMITFLLVLFSIPVVNIQIAGASNPPQRGILGTLIRKPAMQACLMVGIAFWITIGVFEAIWAIFLSDLGATQIFIGLSMSLFGIPMIFISPYAGDLAQRIGSLKIMMVSISVAIACMLTYGSITSLWIILIPLAFHSIADAFTMPAVQMAVTQASGEDALASGQGLYGAVSMAVGTITALAGGLLYETYGANELWWSAAIAMFILMILAWLRGAELKQPYEPGT